MPIRDKDDNGPRTAAHKAIEGMRLCDFVRGKAPHSTLCNRISNLAQVQFQAGWAAAYQHFCGKDIEEGNL